jgi:hypothetical protein
VHRIDVSDDRSTAESVLAMGAQDATSKRLSIVMGNLRRTRHPTDQELGRRALRHLGFLTTEQRFLDIDKIRVSAPVAECFLLSALAQPSFRLSWWAAPTVAPEDPGIGGRTEFFAGSYMRTLISKRCAIWLIAAWRARD